MIFSITITAYFHLVRKIGITTVQIGNQCPSNGVADKSKNKKKKSVAISIDVIVIVMYPDHFYCSEVFPNLWTEYL